MSARTWHILWVVGLAVTAVVWLQSRPTGADPAGPAVAAGGSAAPLPPLASTAFIEPGGEASIVVYVSGAVAQPGLVRLPTAARVADAVAAAGGLLPAADTAAVNLATRVGDGEQIHIPAKGETRPVAAVGSSGSGSSPEVLSLNQASAGDLERLPGVGPVLARRIIDYRDANGPFVVVEDLLGVPGIGEGRLAELRKLVSVP